MTNHSMQLRWILGLGVLLTRLFAGEAHKPAPPAMPVVPFEPAPVQVPYEMPMNGFVAVNIHDKATGKLVRRLVAETPHEKGKISESWDLRDEKGQPVPPGDYTFSGIARPPLKLTYELTVYNSGTPAWFAPEPAKGGGSWLADHTMGSAVAAQKDRIWISAPVAESGNSMIATDLDGVKQWGTGMAHFGFDGPRKIAADERCAYAATPNMLFRVDPTRNFAARNIFTFPNQADMPWAPNHDPSTSGSGLAARDGKIYYAVSAPSSWLKPAFVSDDIDPLRCKPFVYLYKGHGQRKGRDDKSYDFYEYDELMLLYSAFCCEKTPAETPGIPNNPLSSNVRASFGDAPKSGPLRGSVVLTFRHPVTIGSIVVPDGAITVMAMKPGKVMPDTKGDVSAEAAANSGKLKKDDLDDNALLDDFKEGEGLSDDWVQLKTIGVPGKPAIAVAPDGGIKTAAIRYKVNRLKYSLVLTHRFEDVAQQAKRLYTEGKETPNGGWRTTRTDVAINDYRPAAMALSWTAKQQLRGLTLERTPGGTDPEPIKIAIDAWIGEGSPTGPDALKQDASWRQIHYSQYNHTPMVHQMDFDGIVETAGLRVRFVNVRKEYEKYDAGFDSIVAYHPIGGEAKDLPPDMTQRVSIFKLPPADDDKAPATVERHIPIAKPGDLAFDAAGILYCVSAGQVVTVPLKEGEVSRVVVAKDKLEAPLALSVGPDGLIYVGDNGPKVIKVFKQDSGELVKTLGTPGGLKPGKWDPSKFNCPSGMAVDQKGRPWIADWCWAPKRIVRYSADGKPEKEFLGPTQYGGGGTMDAKDRRLIYYAGMKFVIDWDARSWKLDSLMGAVVDRAFYVGERRYLMGPTPQDGRLATIAEEKDGVAKLMAQVGFLREWEAFKTSAELREKFGGMDLTNTMFVWSDLNGDRAPQANEVQTMIAPDNTTWTVGEDLTLLSRSHRLKPVKTLPDGVPIYDLKQIEKYNASVIQGHNDNPWGDDQGRIFMTGAKLIDASGKNLIWNYPNEFNKHDGFYASGFGYNRPPGVLNQEHSPIGHIKVGKEEFFISNSDESDWFCYTADGILVGCIMGGPVGYGKKSWTMPQWEPGLDLSDLRPGQEHYQGCVVRTDDGKVYAVAGHNHMSIVRVDGLEHTQRISGEFKVTDEHVEQTRQWALREAQKRQAAEAPKAAKMLYSSGSPEIDGFHGDWPEELFVTVGETTIRGLKETRVVLDATAALAFDDKNLYVAMKVRDESPLKNSAEDPLTLFKTGDAAEVTLRTDPAAEKSVNVAAGDIRLLFAKVKNKPVAVLYKPVDPGAKPEVHREFSSPVGRVNMDRVEVLSTAKMSFDVKKLKDKIHDGTYWIMEASVPWAALGIKPPEIGAALRGDFGWLESDENGTQTIARHYWSGKAQTVISDLPSEARLNPSLWAAFSVVRPDAKLRIITQKKSMDANDLLKPDAGKELEELLK
jgi:hypothetical protein